MMRLHWKHIAITLAILPIAAILFAWIGFFNVGASSGHWKVTEWFLHFAMRSAVRTYALAVDVPDELPRDGIQPAAGHFARGCAICHGAPGEPRSPAVLRMLPQPPDLARVAGEWNDAELFRIVKHGIRFTGMPAWPTQDRDDEIWAMVAFLRALPRMDEAAYRDLAYGQAPAPPPSPSTIGQAVAECARCHGEDGIGRSPMTPVLAGQRAEYLTESLHAYASAERPSGFMALPAAQINEADLQALAAHFAALPRPTPARAADSALFAKGETMARDGIASARVPACLGCHGGGGRNLVYPDLAGQPAPYLGEQLRLFRDGKRTRTSYAHVMATVAKGLTDEDIAALAAYFSALKETPATSRR